MASNDVWILADSHCVFHVYFSASIHLPIWKLSSILGELFAYTLWTVSFFKVFFYFVIFYNNSGNFSLQATWYWTRDFPNSRIVCQASRSNILCRHHRHSTPLFSQRLSSNIWFEKQVSLLSWFFWASVWLNTLLTTSCRPEIPVFFLWHLPVCMLIAQEHHI